MNRVIDFLHAANGKVPNGDIVVLMLAAVGVTVLICWLVDRRNRRRNLRAACGWFLDTRPWWRTMPRIELPLEGEWTGIPRPSAMRRGR